MTQILIAGGYGLVGRQAAQLLAQRQPQLELVLGGRNPQKAASVVSLLPKARAISFDLTHDDPLATLDVLPDLVLVAVNDQDDNLLRSALRHGVALIDITRWTARVRDAPAWAAVFEPRAPVVLASAWMAAIPATLAAGVAKRFATVSRIDLDILYAMRDQAGPNSVEYLDRLAMPFEVRLDGHRANRLPFSASRRVEFADGHSYTTALFDSPDQMTLPAITQAETVTTHIGFDHELTNRLMMALIRSGLWRAISGPAFTGLRRKMLYNPGDGDHHRVRITLEGKNTNGQPERRVIDLDDPYGQTHLTAVGSVIQVERVLGLSGHAPASNRVQFAEAVTDPECVRATLASVGVAFRDWKQTA